MDQNLQKSLNYLSTVIEIAAFIVHFSQNIQTFLRILENASKYSETSKYILTFLQILENTSSI